MKLIDMAYACAEEGYPIPLDVVVELVQQGIYIDDFINKVDGFQIESLFDDYDRNGV